MSFLTPIGSDSNRNQDWTYVVSDDDIIDMALSDSESESEDELTPEELAAAQQNPDLVAAIKRNEISQEVLAVYNEVYQDADADGEIQSELYATVVRTLVANRPLADIHQVVEAAQSLAEQKWIDFNFSYATHDEFLSEVLEANQANQAKKFHQRGEQENFTDFLEHQADGRDHSDLVLEMLDPEATAFFLGFDKVANVLAKQKGGSNRLNRISAAIAGGRDEQEIKQLLRDYKEERSLQWCPLIYALPTRVAIDCGREDLLPALIESGIDLNWRDSQGHTVLSRAAIQGNEGLMDRLFALGAKAAIPEQFDLIQTFLNQYTGPTLHKLCEKIEDQKKLKAGSYLFTDTPLTPSSIRYLGSYLDKPAETRSPAGHNLWTHAACWHTLSDEVCEAIGALMDINTRDNSGNTVLDYAAEKSSQELLDKLVGFGANTISLNENTALKTMGNALFHGCSEPTLETILGALKRELEKTDPVERLDEETLALIMSHVSIETSITFIKTLLDFCIDFKATVSFLAYIDPKEEGYVLTPILLDIIVDNWDDYKKTLIKTQSDFTAWLEIVLAERHLKSMDKAVEETQFVIQTDRCQNESATFILWQQETIYQQFGSFVQAREKMKSDPRRYGSLLKMPDLQYLLPVEERFSYLMGALGCSTVGDYLIRSPDVEQSLITSDIMPKCKGFLSENELTPVSIETLDQYFPKQYVAAFGSEEHWEACREGINTILEVLREKKGHLGTPNAEKGPKELAAWHKEFESRLGKVLAAAKDDPDAQLSLAKDFGEAGRVCATEWTNTLDRFWDLLIVKVPPDLISQFYYKVFRLAKETHSVAVEKMQSQHEEVWVHAHLPMACAKVIEGHYGINPVGILYDDPTFALSEQQEGDVLEIFEEDFSRESIISLVQELDQEVLMQHLRENLPTEFLNFELEEKKKKLAEFMGGNNQIDALMKCGIYPLLGESLDDAILRTLFAQHLENDETHSLWKKLPVPEQFHRDLLSKIGHVRQLETAEQAAMRMTKAEKLSGTNDPATAADEYSAITGTRKRATRSHMREIARQAKRLKEGFDSLPGNVTVTIPLELQQKIDEVTDERRKLYVRALFAGKAKMTPEIRDLALAMKGDLTAIGVYEALLEKPDAESLLDGLEIMRGPRMTLEAAIENEWRDLYIEGIRDEDGSVGLNGVYDFLLGEGLLGFADPNMGEEPEDEYDPVI